MNKTLIAIALFILSIAACTKDPVATNHTLYIPELNLPQQPYDYNVSWEQSHIGSDLEIENDVATLGRVLFYDKLLSLNNSVACATCHKQLDGFADPVKFSTGYEGKLTTRNSLSIVNASTNGSFFWDGRANSLSQQVVMPIQNHIEMGFSNMQQVVDKLNSTTYYPALFEQAFGTNTISEDNYISEQRISEALAEFVKSMFCYRSKYDAGIKQDFENLSSLEKLGKELFSRNCASCHRPHHFREGWGTGTNIGLDMHSADEGSGNGRFKVPSLRNIALTAPYMHDGRFQTLEEVIEHYNSGIKDHPELDWRLRDAYTPIDPNDHVAGPIDTVFFFCWEGGGGQQFELVQRGAPKRMNLTQQQKSALTAFLETLTDYEFINDPKFSDPFK